MQDEGWMLHAVLMISLFIDESITLSPCPLISPSLRLNGRANFFREAIGILTKLLCNLFNFDPKNGVLSLKSASLF